MIVRFLLPNFCAMMVACAVVAPRALSVEVDWNAKGKTQQIYLAPDPYNSNQHPKKPNPETSRATAGSPSSAGELFTAARDAAERGEAATALRLATEVIAAEPDHAEARAVLGYTQHEGEWLTPYQLRMAKRGEAWHPEFGWLAPEDVERYTAGERKDRRRWISAEADAHDHNTIAKGWQVRTDHFAVTTNHSLQAGADLAAKLESLYQVWQQLFADFHVSDAEIRRRFEGRVPGVQARPFNVVLHRSREEYVRYLTRRQPRIAETLGIYFSREREAHFYLADDQDNDATLYHEAVHQLFQESERGVREPGLRDNFWLLEGVAVYFETLTPTTDARGRRCFLLGDPGAARLPNGLIRLRDEGYYVSMAELAAMGKLDLQGRNDLAPLYGQSAWLAKYLMATPERRQILVEYLSRFYAGKTSATTLAELSGQTYPELDAAFRQFVLETP